MADWRDDLKAVFCMRGFHQEVGVEEDEVLEFLEEQGLTGEFVDGTQWIILRGTYKDIKTYIIGYGFMSEREYISSMPIELVNE